MKYLFLVFNICIISFFLTAQPIKESNLMKADNSNFAIQKKAISIIGIISDENLKDQFSKNNEFPNNYINIELSQKVLPPFDGYPANPDEVTPIDEKNILSRLNKNKIGQQILSTWFNRQPDGSFNFDRMFEKGFLETQDVETICSISSKKEKIFSIAEGLKPVNNSYFLLFDFYKLQTMEQYYNEKDIDKDSRILNGFIASLNCYLIKFDFNNSVAAKFFRDYWISKDSISQKNKIEAFENADFPFFLLKIKNVEIAATQHNPGMQLADLEQLSQEKLLEKLVSLSIEKVITNFEDEGNFTLNKMITGVKPISAFIGKNENLKFGRRYSVFENQINENGDVFRKEIGAVKVMKVAEGNQDKNNLNETSAFYQIAGRKIDNNGMFLEKKGSIGINLYAGKAISGDQSTNGRLEYYFSKSFDGAIKQGKMAKGLTSIKIYFDGGYNKKNYLIEGSNEDFTFIRGSIGVNKDYYPLRFLHWGPFIGYGMESVTWTNSENLISTNFVEAGARVGINIVHNLQLIGSFNKYFQIKTILLDKNRDVINEDFNYNQIFKDHKGSSISLGVRLML